MIFRFILAGLLLAPLLGGCAAVAVTGAVVGGTASLASSAVGTTVDAATGTVDLMIPDGDDEGDAD